MRKVVWHCADKSKDFVNEERYIFLIGYALNCLIRLLRRRFLYCYLVPAIVLRSVACVLKSNFFFTATIRNPYVMNFPSTLPLRDHWNLTIVNRSV